MSTAADYTLIRDEVADLLARVSAHAAAGACHARAGTDRLLAAEVRCCAASLMTVASLVTELAPSRQDQEGRAA